MAIWIALAGILVRVGLLIAMGGRPLSDDAADYHQMAEQLASGVSFEPDWPPGLPYYLWPFHSLFGASPTVDRASMIVVYALFCWLLYGFARRLASERAALIALALFAFYPSFVYLSVTPLTQLPTATLLVGAAWAALAFLLSPGGVPGLGRAALLGLCLGGLVLVRPSNVALCLATPLLLFWSTRRVTALFAPLLLLVLLVGAWTLRAHELTGRWLFVNNANSQNLFYGNNPWTPLYRTWWFGSHKSGEAGVPEGFVATHARLAATPKATRDRAFSEYALDHIRSRPDLFAVRTLARVRVFFAFDTFTGAQIAAKARDRGQKLAGLAVIAVDAAFFVFIAGLALCWFFQPFPPDGRAAWLLGLGVLLYAAPYFVSFSHPTYHFPVLPLLGVAAASWLAERPPLPSGRRRVLWWAAACGLALVQMEWAVNMASSL